jgi:hypothetical protein
MTRWLAAVAVVAVAIAAAAAIGAFAYADRGATRAPDGIAVRGEWKVTVKNPDGRVVRVRRFQNAFNGASTIAPILAHASSTGRYWLTLSDQSGANQQPCGDPAASAASCFVFEADDPNGSIPFWFGNLTVTTPSSTQLVISGEIEATRNGSFNHVRMLLSRCSNATAPNVCHPGAYGNWSSHTLSSPIALVTGQQAIVTVTYTFSAA